MTVKSDTDVKPSPISLLNYLPWVVPLVALLMGFSLFANLKGHPHFVDESAYVSQAYFGDLFLTGQVSSSLWFEYPAYDLPPFTKYLVWAGLVAGGDPRPGPAAMRAWYNDTSKRFESPESLLHARIPIVLCGILTLMAVGRLAECWIGPTGGAIAIVLVASNPLFRSHARQAMADIPTEMGVAVALWLFAPSAGTINIRLRRAIGCGVFLGLAASAKLNGFLASIVLVIWCLTHLRTSQKLTLSLITAGICGASIFIGINPFFYANPQGLREPQFDQIRQMNLLERLKFMADHRIGVSQEGQKLFPNDALTTLPQKISVMAVQGFGRFSPLGPAKDNSEVRFQSSQDWPVVLWLPLVLFGLFTASRKSTQHKAAAWFIITYWVCSLVVVGAFLPLAWNRYFLPIVIPSSILAASGLLEIFHRIFFSKPDSRLPA
jgi:4-amino-4-deoxy-L-arabinose transferase-like glycosyltransferase